MSADTTTVLSWARQRTRVAALLSLLVFALALIALRRLLSEFTLVEIEDAIRALPVSALIWSLLATLASYALLTVFDLVGVRISGKPVPAGAVSFTAFVANAFGHSLGMAALTGGAVRARGYGAFGLNASEVASVVASASLAFAAGAAAWLGLALCFENNSAAVAMHLPPALLVAIGVMLLLVLALVFVRLARGNTSLRIGRHALALPSLQPAVLLTVTSAIELACAAAALYLLLPDNAGVGFLGFTGLFMLAVTAGLISTVPAGLGVFEATMLLLLPQVSAHVLLGSMLAYRAIYYALPLVLAMLALAAREALVRREHIERGAARLRAWTEPLVAPAVAFAVFVAGAVLLVSGAVPLGSERRHLLQTLIPLPVLELSHLLASALGVVLLVLARGLYQRLNAAWVLSMAALVIGAIVALLTGLHWEQALLLAAIAVPLWLARRRYYRPASLFDAPFSWLWIRNIGLVVAAALWLGFFAHRHVDYANELWWKFAFNSDAPRMLRASLMAVLVLLGMSAYALLQPARARRVAVGATERDRVAAVLARHGASQSQIALLPDKQYLFADADAGFVMYARAGCCLVAMGDPVGAEPVQRELVWRLRELADRQGLWTVFYQVSADHLPTYLDLGLSLTKLGEEAIVELGDFSLAGSARAELRQAQRKAQREGATFAVLAPEELRDQLPQLQAISSQWLDAKDTAEKGFSIGYFDAEYLQRFPCAVVYRDGSIVAFANLWRSADGRQLSIDLMRYSQTAPRGVMDYLFVELMLWAQTHGYAEFSLGMAPLSGLSEHALAPAWHKLGRFVWRYGEAFYSFEGLRRYKAKFAPTWRPRYLASPGGLKLPRVLLEVSRLISGGTLNLLPK